MVALACLNARIIPFLRLGGLLCAVTVMLGVATGLSDGQLAQQDRGQAAESSRGRIVRDLEDAVAEAQPLLDRYGYGVLFLAVTVEGIGLLAPGQTLLVAAALDASKNGHLNIAWVFTWAFTAALLGNSLGYLIGRWGGRTLLLKIRMNEQLLERMEGYFARSGKWVLLFARFFEGLRQLNGIVAGMLKMPWDVFITFNILGAILWAGLWAFGTYFFDKEIVSLHLTFRKIEPWALFFTLTGFLAIMVYLLLWHRREHSEGNL